MSTSCAPCVPRMPITMQRCWSSTARKYAGCCTADFVTCFRMRPSGICGEGDVASRWVSCDGELTPVCTGDRTGCGCGCLVVCLCANWAETGLEGFEGCILEGNRGMWGTAVRPLDFLVELMHGCMQAWMTNPEVGCKDRELELVGSHGPTQPMKELRQLGSTGKVWEVV